MGFEEIDERLHRFRRLVELGDETVECLVGDDGVALLTDHPVSPGRNNLKDERTYRRVLQIGSLADERVLFRCYPDLQTVPTGIGGCRFHWSDYTCPDIVRTVACHFRATGERISWSNTVNHGQSEMAIELGLCEIAQLYKVRVRGFPS